MKNKLLSSQVNFLMRFTNLSELSYENNSSLQINNNFGITYTVCIYTYNQNCERTFIRGEDFSSGMSQE